MKKYIFMLIFIYSLINNLYSQEVGTIKVGTFLNDKKIELENEGIIFSNPNEICFLLETYSGTFGQFKILVRILKFENDAEIIYKSEIDEIEPDWDWYSSCYYLPKGMYQFKIYNIDGVLIAKSNVIIIK